LKKNSFTIICNNCIAGVIYSDFGRKFQSPTINLFFYATDYIKFLENLKFYLKQQIKFSKDSKHTNSTILYPIGILGDIEIHFQHYESEQDAADAWHRRIQRIDYDNLFIIGSDRDNSTEEIRQRFSELSFEHKIYFTSKPCKYKQEIFFEEYKEQDCIGELIDEDKAWYFYFDVPKWINEGIIKKNILKKSIFRYYRKLKHIVLAAA
jgi:uncharacterized protein (DUF1919 family)